MHDEFITVPLSKGKFAIIDAEDADRVLAHKWHVIYIKGCWYAATSVNQRRLYLHRFIMDAPKGSMVDHRDGDGLNCRKDNLRFCTSAQNQANSPRHKVGPSGYRGVCRQGRRGGKHAEDRWVAGISVGNRHIHLGSFGSPEEAARAYDAKARELRGEFAVLNFPD